MRRRRRKGSPVVADEGGVGGGAAERVSARGSACSKQSTTAKRGDTVVQHGDGVGRDYGGGTATAASAMARECEGEEPGANGRVQGVGESEVVRPASTARWGERRGGGSC